MRLVGWKPAAQTASHKEQQLRASVVHNRWNWSWCSSEAPRHCATYCTSLKNKWQGHTVHTVRTTKTQAHVETHTVATAVLHMEFKPLSSCKKQKTPKCLYRYGKSWVYTSVQSDAIKAKTTDHCYCHISHPDSFWHAHIKKPQSYIVVPNPHKPTPYNIIGPTAVNLSIHLLSYTYQTPFKKKASILNITTTP